MLDLSLISEAVSYQSLNQTLRQLPDLTELYMPRCSTHYEKDMLSMRITWPPRLQHLSLSGSVHGKFLWEMTRQPDTFPPTLTSMSVLHCPSLEYSGIKPLLVNMASTLTAVELRDLPQVPQGRFNGILNWLPHLTRLSIALAYIDDDFARIPDDFDRASWARAKPLQELALVTSASHGSTDPERDFAIVDLWELIDRRFLGRLRLLKVARSTGWEYENEGAALEALNGALCEGLDKENWEKRRWHYEGLKEVPEGMTYAAWRETPVGRRMRARVVIMRDR